MREEKGQRECFPSVFWLDVVFLFEAIMPSNMFCF